jgi:hypothetical protein
MVIMLDACHSGASLDTDEKGFFAADSRTPWPARNSKLMSPSAEPLSSQIVSTLW